MEKFLCYINLITGRRLTREGIKDLLEAGAAYCAVVRPILFA